MHDAASPDESSLPHFDRNVEFNAKTTLPTTTEPLARGEPRGNSSHTAEARARHRWYVLALASIMLAGQFYVYDNPAALGPELTPRLKIDAEDSAYLVSACYSVYSFPNIVLPFMGGLALDRYGIAVVMATSVALVLVGQSIFASAMSMHSPQLNGSYPTFSTLLIVGRVVMGLGGEIMSVAASSVVTAWFTHRGLAFALALLLSFARLGSVANANLTPVIVESLGIGGGAWAGSVVMALSLASALGIIFCFRCTPHKNGNHGRRHRRNRSVSRTSRGRSDSHGHLIPSSAHHHRNNSSPPLTLYALRRKTVRFWRRWILPLPGQFWLLAVICTLLYGTIIPFINIASGMMRQKWFPNDPQRAGLAMGIPDSISALLVPPLGYMHDKYRSFPVTLGLAGAVLMLSHLLLLLPFLYDQSAMPLLYRLSPYVPLLVLGAGYSLYGVAVWPAIAYSVRDAKYNNGNRVQNQESNLGSDGDLMDPDTPRAAAVALFSRSNDDFMGGAGTVAEAGTVHSNFSAPVLRSAMPYFGPAGAVAADSDETLASHESERNLIDAHGGDNDDTTPPHILNIITNDKNSKYVHIDEEANVSLSPLELKMPKHCYSDKNPEKTSGSSSALPSPIPPPMSPFAASSEIVSNSSPQQPKDFSSVAYGIQTSFMNLALTIIPFMLALTVNESGYKGAEIIFVMLSTMALVLAAALHRIWHVTDIR